ncbi:YvcK family protein [Candidatus Microgenomates bacterium]|nr:YvcK family protein [Candidatus Microgenomates bacterium]
MTKYGQTYGFSATTHIETLEKYIGGAVLDYVMVNTAEYPEEALKAYVESHEEPVKDDLSSNAHYTIVRADIVNDQKMEKSKSDSLVRSLIRHDSDKLAKTIVESVLGGV